MPLDVAAQGEQEGLEPCPDPQRRFLTYRFPLDFKQEEGGQENDRIISCYHRESNSHLYAKIKLHVYIISIRAQSKAGLTPRLLESVYSVSS